MLTLPRVRLVIAASLDGRLALSSGGKGDIGGSGDKKALEEALAWSDATLMGRTTLSLHQSTCLIHDKRLINQRRKEGRTDQPLSLIVSKQGSIDNSWRFFKQPIKKWLLSPSKISPLILKSFDDQLVMRETWGDTLEILNQKGFSKIALLGGTKLITSLLLEDKIDELQITFVPRILTGKHSWTSVKIGHLPIGLSQANTWVLEELKDIGGSEVLLKYVRNRT